MNVTASLFLYIAHALAPKADKLWIEDMRLESRFVPNQLSFALSALGLALKFRMSALKLNRPVGIAFGSVALAAVATVFVVPRLFGNDTTNAAMTQPQSASYETVEDLAQERGYSAAAQDVADADAAMTQSAPQPVSPAPGVVAEAELQTGSPTEAEPPDSASYVETPLDVTTAQAPLEQEPLAEVLEPPAATPPAPAATMPATTNAAEPIDATDAATSEQRDESSMPSSATAEATASVAAKLPEPATPSVDTEVISTQVKDESVIIQITGDALLTLYRDTNFSGSPRAHRYVIAGESFTANAPFSLYTNNAGAVTVTVDGESSSLGKSNEEQFRIFSKP